MGCGGDSDGSKGNSELEKALAHALTSRTLHTMAPGGKVCQFDIVCFIFLIFAFVSPLMYP
jgi:hypothetical protein